jgi:L-ascorbate metabolism protein UlaG (beta-lactamase superfamily)
MIILLAVLLLITLGIVLYLRQPQFGAAPTGARLERIRKSKHYQQDHFENLSHTPQLTEGYTIGQVLYEFMFKKGINQIPAHRIPTVKTNLHDLPLDQDVLVWFGHSSYYFQLEGKRFLVDPVLSGSASPLPRTNKAFNGADIYTVDDLPNIDVLIITHDHYDHIDYKTLKKLQPKVTQVMTGLGVGAHLERWGYAAASITECDWYDTVSPIPGSTLYTLPTRHFSGRTFKRNVTLWVSFLIETASFKLYVGGDSGYDTHFAEAGKKHGPIDLAVLENGQYDVKWKYIHFQPKEVLQAARDLRAKRLMPVHSGKFKMANHAWDEPLSMITELNEAFPIPLVTPKIGEVVFLRNEKQHFENWWEKGK